MMLESGFQRVIFLSDVIFVRAKLMRDIRKRDAAASSTRVMAA